VLELLLFFGLLFVGVAVLIGIGNWTSTKRPLIRNLVSLCLSAGAAYAVGFLLTMWTHAANGAIRPPINVLAPSVTWLTVAATCICAAVLTKASRYAIAAPFVVEALSAFALAPAAQASLMSPEQQALFIGVPLFLVGAALLVAVPRSIQTAGAADPAPGGAGGSSRTDQPPSTNTIATSFQIGEYRLDAPAPPLVGLVEFSLAEYAALGGRFFKGETVYHARPELYLGRTWDVMLQSVDGRITKIGLVAVHTDKQEANRTMALASNYCIGKLGHPAGQKSGLSVWDAADGNVVLQGTSKTLGGWLVALHLTSRSIRSAEWAGGG